MPQTPDILLPNGDVLGVQVYIKDTVTGNPEQWDGAITGGGGGAVTIADGADVAQGAKADSAATNSTSSWTIISLLKGLYALLASTLTVSGTVTANAGTNLNTSALATSANQTNATQKTQIVDGSGNVIASHSNAADVSIRSQASDLTVAQATATSLNAQVVGDVSSGSSDSGKPVKIGSLAQTSLPTAVSTGQRVNNIADVYGRSFVRTGHQGPSASYSHSQHNPSANTKATITKSAGAGTIRNVCTGLTVSLASSSTTAPAAIQVTVALIDGSSGGTTYLWGPTVIALPAVAGAISAFVLSNCWKPGSQATAMTLEFSAAGGANTIESVSMDVVQLAE